MGKINVLDKFTAEKIAAGEVVERPASVVKELVENAIDAGATMVTVEIKKGGTLYMRVTDNGSGMDKNDARAAFLRHATSKIKTDRDLESISTLGFRGEALCSIAAVSRTELFTKERGKDEGTHVVMEGGEEISCSGVGCPDGTTIVVKNLFFNTPARLKFLKKDSTEAAAVSDVCNKQALSHPNVSLKLIRDGEEILFTPGDNLLKSAVHSVLGREIASSMEEVEYEKSGIHVYGLTGKNNLSRPNRLMQICFINGRYIVNKTILTAISDAYKNELMVGRFPVAVLNIDLSPAFVDVNVHPGKTEVKFADDSLVYEAVYWAVKSALEKAASPRIVMENQPQKNAYNFLFDKKEIKQVEFKSAGQSTYKSDKFKPYTPEIIKKENPVKTVDEIREAVMPYGGKLPVREIEGAENAKTETSPTKKFPEKEQKQEAGMLPDVEKVRIIGQLFGTYILVEYEDSFLLLDQHAAHERIRYEEIKARGDRTETQMLLMPISVTLTPNEKNLMLQNNDFLTSLGFEVEDFGQNAVVIRTLPADCPYDEGADLFVELLSVLEGAERGEVQEARDRAVYTVACRSAIKANNILSEAEMKEVYVRASRLEGISTCPHGRPISVKMSKYSVEKMFSRT